MDEIRVLLNRMAQLEAANEKLASFIDQHAEVINGALASQQASSRTADFIGRMESLLEKQFESASTYTTVVIGGAYAGLFTLWNFLNGHTSAEVLAFCGILILVSMSVFVLHEVANVLMRGLQQYEVLKLPRPTTAEEVQTYTQAVEAVFRRRLLGVSVWLGSLFVSVIFGLTAAIVLFVAFAQVAIGPS